MNNILIDIGNTTIQVAIYQDDNLIIRHIVSTDLNKAEGDYYITFFNLFNAYLNNNISHIIISSVVPSLNTTIKAIFKRLFNVEPLILGLGFKTKVIFKIDNIKELGSDIICDVCGGIKKYSYPLIIVDLGTASKILHVDQNGVFTGCIIAPGIAISKQTLTKNTALLPDIDFNLPKNIIGKNSIDAIKSGVIFGHALMIEGFVNKIKEEYKLPYKTILTGGNARIVKEILTKKGYIFDDTLLLDGLNEILKKNI